MFGPVEPSESGTVLLLFLNLFVLLVAYYVLKTVREPLILTGGGAEMKSYAAAFQAATLIGFVPAYAWMSTRVERSRLVVAMGLFFAATLEVFYLASLARVPYLGFAFYVWVGIFSNAAIALFWSYANDLHDPKSGERLFPVIAIGAAAGSPVGSRLAERLFEGGASPYHLMHLAAGLLVLQLALYRIVERRTRGTPREKRAPLASGPGGFGLVLRSPYLRLVSVLLVVLNLVNSTGEYVLGRSVVSTARLAAAANPAFDVTSYIGGFYGRYFFWVNVASVLLQAFLAARIVKRFGVAGALLALPIVAFGAYALVAAGAGLAAIRWAKTAENAVDYSMMNTGKQMLWLPTAREEKYKAKQAIDGFFVRAGDLLSAGVVYAGTSFQDVGIFGFAAINLVLLPLWAATAWALVKRYRALRVGGS